MINLKNGLLPRLSQGGAQILSRSGDPGHGYRFDEVLGKSTDWVRISPLKPAGSEMSGYVPEGRLRSRWA